MISNQIRNWLVACCLALIMSRGRELAYLDIFMCHVVAYLVGQVIDLQKENEKLKGNIKNLTDMLRRLRGDYDELHEYNRGTYTEYEGLYEDYSAIYDQRANMYIKIDVYTMSYEILVRLHQVQRLSHDNNSYFSWLPFDVAELIEFHIYVVVSEAEENLLTSEDKKEVNRMLGTRFFILDAD